MYGTPVPELSRPGCAEAVRRGLALQPRLDQVQRGADQCTYRPASRPGRQIPEEKGHLMVTLRIGADDGLHRREEGQPRAVHQYLLISRNNNEACCAQGQQR